MQNNVPFRENSISLFNSTTNSQTLNKEKCHTDTQTSDCKEQVYNKGQSKQNVHKKDKKVNYSKTQLKKKDHIDYLYVKNLQDYTKEVVEENFKLKEKNSELEALLSAAYDEIEDYEKALIEITQGYQKLVQKVQFINKLKESKQNQYCQTEIELKEQEEQIQQVDLKNNDS